jgi:protein TonB
VDPLTSPPEKPRRPLRPLYGIPDAEPRGRTGWLLSALLHAVILVALLLPPFVARQLVEPEQTGAGGAGPAGGGGGGSRGSGGDIKPERVRFLQMAPAAAPTPPKATPTPTPTPPPPPVEPEPEKVVQRDAAPETAPTSGPTIPTPGAGGGTGNDGSGGNGPGTGGGIGSGVGTGRGSGVGPGTGGGGDVIYPPTVTNLPILPVPVPNRVKPYRLVAQFEVDERGNARLLAFNPSSDRAYNRKIRDMLNEVRFRPATRFDGTAVKDTYSIIWEAR